MTSPRRPAPTPPEAPLEAVASTGQEGEALIVHRQAVLAIEIAADDGYALVDGGEQEAVLVCLAHLPGV